MQDHSWGSSSLWWWIVVSDNGTAFISQEFKTFVKKMEYNMQPPHHTIQHQMEWLRGQCRLPNMQTRVITKQLQQKANHDQHAESKSFILGILCMLKTTLGARSGYLE